MKKVWLLLSSVVLLSGCATMDTVRPKDEARTYPHRLPVVYEAAKAAALDVGLTIVDEAPDK
jgi:uncharacterized protein YceK